MQNNIKVVILCGGMGTRLREETEFKPKPLVKIGSHPILWHIMKIYSYYGLHNFILCLGYKGEMIKEYFYHYEVMNNDFTIKLGNMQGIKIHDCHDEAGWQITLCNTGDNAQKGARLKRIEKYVDTETVMVTYGDGVADINIDDLLNFHNSHGKLATVTGVRPPSRFGELKASGRRVRAFSEKPQSSGGLINGGFFVFQRGFFDYLEDHDACDLEYGALEEIARRGELMLYRHEGFWACMDTYRDMEYLNKLWNRGEAAWEVWRTRE
jgi:glucose-1-phosphate cytidylyltransferase